MTLRKWIDSLEDNVGYRYFMHMGDNYYAEMPLGEILATQRYAKHSNFKIRIENGCVYIILKKPWSHKGRFAR
jgi:hypothetical protein